MTANRSKSLLELCVASDEFLWVSQIWQVIPQSAWFTEFVCALGDKANHFCSVCTSQLEKAVLHAVVQYF